MIFLSDLGTGEEAVSVEQTQVFVLQSAQQNTNPLQVELHRVFLSDKFLFK